MPSKKLNIDNALAKLDNLVNTMEQGELSLDESLKHFEQGVKLIKDCQQSLKQAEQKVQILIGDHLENFEHDIDQD